MPGQPSTGGRFGFISGLVGLTLCVAQTVNGHMSARSERERMQEAHEQKMHFLHELHRTQLRGKEMELEHLGRENEAREREMGWMSQRREGAMGKFGDGERWGATRAEDWKVGAREREPGDGCVEDRNVGPAGE